MSNSAAHCLGDTARYIYIYFSCCFGTTGNFNHRRKKPPPPCATVWPTLRALFLSLSLSLPCQLLRLILVVVNVVFDVFVCNQWKIYDNTHNRTQTYRHTHPHTHKDTRIDCASVALPSFLCHIIIFIMTLPAAASATLSARPVIREWLVTKNDNNNNCICVCVCACLPPPLTPTLSLPFSLALSYSIEPHERWPIQDIRYDSQISTNICYYSQRAPSKIFQEKLIGLTCQRTVGDVR